MSRTKSVADEDRRKCFRTGVLSPKEAARLDRAVAASKMTRSDFIRATLMAKIEKMEASK